MLLPHDADRVWSGAPTHPSAAGPGYTQLEADLDESVQGSDQATDDRSESSRESVYEDSSPRASRGVGGISTV